MREARLFAGLVVGVVALIVSVWLVGARAADSISDAEARARARERADAVRTLDQQNDASRSACRRGVARDYELIGTNQDLRQFALDAARARRADGNVVAARRYTRRAASAKARIDRVKLRVPEREDEATIAEFCARLWPKSR